MPKTIKKYLNKANKAKAAINKFRKNKGLEPYFDEPKKAKSTAIPLRANSTKGARARAITIAVTKVNEKSEIEGILLKLAQSYQMPKHQTGVIGIT